MSDLAGFYEHETGRVSLDTVLPEALPFNSGVRSTLLADHDCLVLEDNDVWHFRVGETDQAVRVPARVRCRHGDAVSALCLAGAGIALKSVWDAVDELESRRLVRLLGDYPILEPADISILLPQRRYVAPRVRRFIETLRDHIGDPPPWAPAPPASA